MLDDRSKYLLLRQARKTMKKHKMTLKEVIDLTQEGVDFLKTVLNESDLII
jgi:hypothetical protein